MTDGASRVRGPHGVALLLFGLVWLSIAWFDSGEFNPNNATRLFTAIALSERGTPTIDRFQVLTVDKAMAGEHYTMDKAPGTTLMATPIVWSVNRLSGSSSADQVVDITSLRFAGFLRLRLRLVVMLGLAPLTALAAVLLLDLGTGITGSPAAGLFAALGYALGSIVWGWSTTLFGHAPAAALLTIATWAVWRGSDGDIGLQRRRYPLIAGLALGWAAVIEFPAALPGLAIAGWAVWRTRAAPPRLRRRVLGMAAAGLVALGPLLAYDQLAFGSPFRLGYAHVVGFTGMRQGWFGITYPKPGIVVELLVGSRRGLVWVAPVLIAGAIGLAWVLRERTTRDLGVLAAAVVATVLLVNASYVYWDGGASTGPRHSVPAIPFLALGLAPFWAGLRRGWSRIAVAGLLAVSMLLNLLIAETGMFAADAFWAPLVARGWRMPPPGTVTDLPGEWLGWSPLQGLALYLDIALPMLAAMLLLTRRAEAIRRGP